MFDQRKGLRLFLGLAAGTLVLACAGIVYAAAAKAGQPTAVVTVNLASVLDKLNQRSDSEVALKAMVEKMQAEEVQLKAGITKMQEDLQAIKDDSKAKQDLQEQLAMATLKYQAWARFSTDKIDIEKALVLQDIYRSIKLAVAQMASSSGFDVVLVDDSQGELTTSAEARVSRESQIRQQIAGRRMLYGNPSIDITDELITRMNNAHKSGIAATPAAGAPAAAATNGKKP